MSSVDFDGYGKGYEAGYRRGYVGGQRAAEKGLSNKDAQENKGLLPPPIIEQLVDMCIYGEIYDYPLDSLGDRVNWREVPQDDYVGDTRLNIAATILGMWRSGQLSQAEPKGDA